MASQTAIVDLSKIGAFIALAFRRYLEELYVVGLGAISKGFIALHRCARESKL